MDHFGLPDTPLVDKQVFTGNIQAAGASWQTWNKPLGKSMCSMLVIGSGGGGGTGAIGANSTAAGGGGGGSGAVTVIRAMPLDLLPQRLYVAVGQAKTGAGVASYVSTIPTSATTNTVVAKANGGGVGGNAAGATAGAAGAAGAASASSEMPLGWIWATSLAGQAGIIGGVAVSGGALTLPTTIPVTGGTGGGGLPAAAATGTNGGAITGIASPSYLQGITGGQGSATATNPAAPGKHGFFVPEAGFFYYGGTGGASTHGTATGGGLVQAAGGNGGIGSGGGGMGGALTGSAAASASYGGPGLVIIWCF